MAMPAAPSLPDTTFYDPVVGVVPPRVARYVRLRWDERYPLIPYPTARRRLPVDRLHAIEAWAVEGRRLDALLARCDQEPLQEPLTEDEPVAIVLRIFPGAVRLDEQGRLP